MDSSLVTTQPRVLLALVTLLASLLLDGLPFGPSDRAFAKGGNAGGAAPAPSPAPPAPSPVVGGSSVTSEGAAADPNLLATQSQMESVFSGFFAVGLDVNRPLELQDFHLAKDAMEMTLK